MVCVCDYCHSLIARSGANAEVLGKVPDLVAIDTRLALGDTGRMQEQAFKVLGRLQLHQGSASWNEWYVSWGDGSFGWLAEAAGRVIVTRRWERQLDLPAFERLRVGQALTLSEVGTLMIEELGDARVLSAQGELPFVPQLDYSYRFADGSMRGGRYATLHYGDADEPVELFVGRELSYEDAGLAQADPERSWQAPQTSGRALRCTSCAGPLSPKLGSRSVVCPYCHALLSFDHGELARIRALERREQPALPLGASGELFGRKLQVIGWARRAVTVDHLEYCWDEYLLHGPNGYAFLSESKGHWTYFRLLPMAELSAVTPRAATYRNHRYAHFQSSHDVRYVDVQGEFYWEIDPDERAQMEDYVRPPHQLSLEHTVNERIWTHGEYVPADQLWKSFGQSGEPPAQHDVGACQPNPYAKHKRGVLTGLGMGVALFLLCTVALALLQPRQLRYVHHVPIEDDQPVSLSEPFLLRGGRQAVAIRARSEFSGNGWAGLAVSLIEEESGRSEDLDMEVSQFSGYSDGEAWREDHRDVEKRLGALKPGRYVLRVEPQFDSSYLRPSALRLEVAQGAFLWAPFWLCLFALVLPPLIWLLLHYSFEARRWAESDHAHGGES